MVPNEGDSPPDTKDWWADTLDLPSIEEESSGKYNEIVETGGPGQLNGDERHGQSDATTPPGNLPPNEPPSGGDNQGSGGGGDMSNLERRVQGLESGMSEVRNKLDGMGNTLSRMEERISHMATDANVQCVRADVESVRTEVQRMENQVIRWIVGTLIGLGLFSIGLVNYF